MRVGHYTSTSSYRGYDPHVDPAWEDPGSLTPNVMHGLSVWRMNAGTKNGEERVAIKLTGGDMGTPEGLSIGFSDGQIYNMTQIDYQTWESYDSSFYQRFQASNLYFSINGSGQPVPPPEEFDYRMNVGEWSSGSTIRGFDGYISPSDRQYGSLSPMIYKGATVRRFRTGSNSSTSADYEVILYFGPTVSAQSLTVVFSTGEFFTMPRFNTNEYRVRDSRLWNLFQNNDTLYFTIT